MRMTKKRNGKNVIPLLNAVCGIDLPYWRIGRADSLHSYLSGDAADKLAAYEDAEEQGRLVILPCKVRDYVRKPQTRADRIREKSDEELAEFLGTLPCCPPGEDLEELCFPLDSCEGTDFNVKCWLKWLRQKSTQKGGGQD